ncbi:MAG: peptidylprolyl isomerase [Oscillospiraceae bacterium]|nr:peptidylprolyl isomerase [Oscillospiraceae bacterium]
MKKTRILSLIIAAFMLCTLLAGCDDGAKTVMKVGGARISKDIYASAIVQSNMMFEQTYGMSLASMLGEDMGDGQTTGADLLKEYAENLIIEFETYAAVAKENGIKLTEEDRKTMKEAKEKQIEAAGSRKAFIEKFESEGISESFYDYVLGRSALFSRIQSELFTGEGKYAPTAEKIAETFGKDLICVKHVLVMAKEADADYAEKKAKAESIAKRAKNGEDFDALIAEFGEDPGMETNKGGYVMDTNGYTPTGGSMVAEFTAAATALEVGGVSDIVPSSYGFHIIKRYPMSAEHIATDLEGFTAQLGNPLIGQVLSEYMEGIEVEYTKEYEKIDLYEILNAEKTIGDEVGIEDAHAGHNHGAEGEEIPEITLTPAE